MQLATAEREGFAAAALPLLRAIFPTATATPSSRSFDRAGIDHLVWGDGEELDLVVQCKGFDAGTLQLGGSQVEQCRKSIAAFRESGLRARRYLLIHNRDGRDEAFRDRIRSTLDELVACGSAGAAELLDRQSLLRRGFDAVRERVDLALRQNSARIWADELSQRGVYSPLTEVPLTRSLLLVDQHAEVATSAAESGVADPTVEIASDTEARLFVLLGEFGVGKTTALLRLLHNAERTVIYAPAQVFSSSITSTKDFLLACVDHQGLFGAVSEDDLPTLELLVRPVLEYVLKDPDLPVTLVLDGIDESAFLARRGGLQHLFNLLRSVRAPVVLCMRTEFWASRRTELALAFGPQAAHGERQRQRVRLLELLPWSDDHLRQMVDRLGAAETPERAARLSELSGSIGTDRFTLLFGDIPRRPLFLRQIVDAVAEDGMPDDPIKRSSLMTRWARLKIYRDILEARRFGGEGRGPLVAEHESAETIESIVWEAMIEAARLMTQRREGTVDLLGSCSVDELLDRSPRLRRIVEPTTLVLHSLLQPVIPARPGYRELRFAHRAFQEFFLAEAVRADPEAYAGVELPAAVLAWQEAPVGGARTQEDPPKRSEP